MILLSLAVAAAACISWLSTVSVLGAWILLAGCLGISIPVAMVSDRSIVPRLILAGLGAAAFVYASSRGFSDLYSIYMRLLGVLLWVGALHSSSRARKGGGASSGDR
jgi:hypothetical protein